VQVRKKYLVLNCSHSFPIHVALTEKLSKIKKVERLELEEEQRQAQLAEAGKNGVAEADKT